MLQANLEKCILWLQLWHAYLSERRLAARGARPTDPQLAKLNGTYERALVSMHKMPRIWTDVRFSQPSHFLAIMSSAHIVLKTARSKSGSEWLHAIRLASELGAADCDQLPSNSSAYAVYVFVSIQSSSFAAASTLGACRILHVS